MSWAQETVFHDGDRFFAALCREIDRARTRIDFETYIFDRDHIGKKVLEHLSGAARRGVKVRLLLDGFGCSQWSHADVARLAKTGVQVRFFHPLPWQMNDNRWWTFRLRFARLNRRNHRKAAIIDAQTAFIGGMNVSARHSARMTGQDSWRDTSVKVVGKDVRFLSEAFDHAWGRQRRRITTQTGSVRLNVTRAQRRSEHADLVKRVAGARHRVWITNPYFAPDLSVIRALRFAAWSGVDVRLLFPEKNDVRGMRWAARAFYSTLLRAGVGIYEFKPTVLHAKIVLIDDWVKVGSSNFNSRSFVHDLEADVVLDAPESLASIENRFKTDRARSRPINAESWRRRSWLRRLFERLVLLFRRWI